MVNIMADDDLVIQGDRVSSASILTWLFQNIVVSAPQGLSIYDQIVPSSPYKPQFKYKTHSKIGDFACSDFSE